MYVLFLTTNIVVYSQELPTEPANGFTFPIGSKFTIKLHPIDSVSFNYSIMEFEPFQEIIDTWDNDEEKRFLYVAMTRAKQNLMIHLNDNYLNDIYCENIEPFNDYFQYNTPNLLIMHLSHKDIWLDFFI